MHSGAARGYMSNSFGGAESFQNISLNLSDGNFASKTSAPSVTRVKRPIRSMVCSTMNALTSKVLHAPINFSSEGAEHAFRCTVHTTYRVGLLFQMVATLNVQTPAAHPAY